ncbi:hypothetical protein NP026_23355, partial [Salmonella enterica]|nr:hypothetical protein [Salmonella enterica]
AAAEAISVKALQAKADALKALEEAKEAGARASKALEEAAEKESRSSKALEEANAERIRLGKVVERLQVCFFNFVAFVLYCFENIYRVNCLLFL